MEIAALNNVLGERGENIALLCLTEYVQPNGVLFGPGFLGAKWPTIDYYIELYGVQSMRPYFFASAKTTTSRLTKKSIQISVKKEDVQQLLKIPGPTYILAIHEPSKRVFAKSVHALTKATAIKTVRLANELTNKPEALFALHQEVVQFWGNTVHKPNSSHFS
ncbi:MAG TPA: hypothetical protein VK970_12595 [Candidatus Methylacidiphilales bacterium]|nr:hypothetical protein [Candidatus Methylacidiphilales bacterium]